MESTQELEIEFGGKIIIATATSHGSTVTNWIHEISSAHGSLQSVVVGLDVEWKPNRRWRENNKAATLQLCLGTKCLIVQLFYLDYIPTSLSEFLSDTKYVFVGVEVESDVAKLREDYHLVCGRHGDVKKAAIDELGDWRFSRRPGLKEIAEVVAGIRLKKPKRVSISNWEMESLTEEQIEYACLDAYASFRIGMKLHHQF